MPSIIEARDIRKRFQTGASEIDVLKGIDLSIGEGEFIAIMGQSGSGKSTLLNVLGCLENPSSGTYLLNGKDVSRADDRELSEIRSASIGFIFQSFNLLPQLNVYENVELPFLYRRGGEAGREERIREAIVSVGLSHREDHLPSELSGGEMQRVAIARALASDPAVILADEPTGNLDTATGKEILGLFRKIHDGGRTILMVTHDRGIASCAQRVLTVKDGLIS